MHIAYVPYFHKIYKFPPIFVRLRFFSLFYVLLLPPYFDPDAFTQYTYWMPLAKNVVSCGRYGGLSFGEENDRIQVNKTQLEQLVNRILTLVDSLGSSSALPNNETIPAIIENVQYLFSRLAISKNAKVCTVFCLLCLYFIHLFIHSF